MKKETNEHFSRLKENRNNIIISTVSGATAGAIIGALFWLVFKKNKIYITNWLSTIGTFFAVFVSLYLSFKNDQSHKEELKTMKLPYFRIDREDNINLDSLFVEPMGVPPRTSIDNLAKLQTSLENKIELSVKILNIKEVETLLDFKMVVRLAINSNEGKNEGYIYCSPIKEMSASLEESKYILKLAGTKVEQLEQLKKCFFLNELDSNESLVKKACNEFYNINIKNFSKDDMKQTDPLLLNPLSLSDYISEVEFQEINKNYDKFPEKYHLVLNNIYISCKTILGAEVLYEYSKETGETYYRADKKEIYAGSEVSSLTLETDMANLQRAINKEISLANKDVPLKSIGQEESNKEITKKQEINQIYKEEYEKLHNKLNEIRESKKVRTYSHEDLKHRRFQI